MQPDSCWHLYSLGIVEYRQALCLQKKLVVLRQQDKIPNTLLLLEHPHTYTLGSKSRKKHFNVPPEWITQGKVAVHNVDRGGEITYHGPGQLVGYPIIQLDHKNMQVGRYIRMLEAVLIRTLQSYGIQGQEKTEQSSKKHVTGVWVGDAKIGSIGINVDHRRVASHGFSLNVNTDLGYFKKIVPCGLEKSGVVSMAWVKGRELAMDNVKAQLISAFAKEFNVDFIPCEVRQIDKALVA
ncbi:MAG: lipoyl(octanoyl) transferase LipB [Desulfobulbaceae bacterium]|nr:lipoyl(octanoyl) transferase LipB [Desulfobulbaceae bacterium]